MHRFVQVSDGHLCNKNHFHMGLVATKPVFRVSDKARLKPACSATESSWKNEISLVGRYYIFQKANNKGADQAGLGLCCSQKPQTGFLASRPI